MLECVAYLSGIVGRKQLDFARAVRPAADDYFTGQFVVRILGRIWWAYRVKAIEWHVDHTAIGGDEGYRMSEYPLFAQLAGQVVYFKIRYPD